MAEAAPRGLSASKWLQLPHGSALELFGSGLEQPRGPPAAVALALLSGEVGAALGLAGRCGDSTQLGKATVAGFQARHGSPGMGQNRCALRKAAMKG